MPVHRLVGQASLFMSPRDRVVQLHPRTLDTHFSRLLRRTDYDRAILNAATTREIREK
jgi:hypothetical protein